MALLGWVYLLWYLKVNFLSLQWHRLDDLYRIVLVAIYIVYFVIESIRLYLGYLGNLMERVSTEYSPSFIF